MEPQETPSLEQLEPQKTSRSRNARRMLVAAMLVAFLGGPCALQDAMPSSLQVPTKAEYLKKLNDSRVLEQQHLAANQIDAMAEASIAFLKAQQSIRKRFEAPQAVFNLFLMAAYMAIFILASRTWRLGNENVVRLSKAALVALPARVAVAAIELAAVVQMRPTLETFFRELSLHGTIEASVTGDTLLDISSILGQSASTAYLVFFWIKTILVVAFLYAVYRYFERPDVQALFARENREETGRDI